MNEKNFEFLLYSSADRELEKNSVTEKISATAADGKNIIRNFII